MEAAMAEDAAKVAPHIYKVLFENEQVRLLEVIMQPGDSSEMHSHPGNLLYVLSDGKVTFTDPSGDTADLAVTAGTSMWMEATDHATEKLAAPISTRSSSSQSRATCAIDNAYRRSAL
jgi:quercetin dioxygenase-like cupin family protein